MSRVVQSDPRLRYPDGDRAVLVHQTGDHGPDEEAVEEFRRLGEATGAVVVGSIVSRRRRPDPATFFGSGKAREISDLVAGEQATVVLVDHALSPVQERNLESAVGCPVVDRTRLILDIFARRATSREGKLQVELAQLEHLSTRLVRGWTHLERQKGGIGLRGPGETQLETDRRLIAHRMRKLKRELERVESQRDLRRKSRRKVPIATVSLVGYTNAGKSSLFNRMTDARVYAADQLFATLDPTMRRLEVDGYGAVILSDTVGFIRDLPHSLVTAFHSTLEEVALAALLLHVVDVSNPEHLELAEHVHSVLEEIGAAGVPRLTVFNKIDKTGLRPRLENDASGRPARVWLSAASGEGIGCLHRAMADVLGSGQVLQRLRLPAEATKLRARIYDFCQVVAEDAGSDGTLLLDVRLDDRTRGWLESQPEFLPEYGPVSMAGT